jgi:hypothetical protein
VVFYNLSKCDLKIFAPNFGFLSIDWFASNGPSSKFSIRDWENISFGRRFLFRNHDAYFGTLGKIFG